MQPRGRIETDISGGGFPFPLGRPACTSRRGGGQAPTTCTWKPGRTQGQASRPHSPRTGPTQPTHPRRPQRNPPDKAAPALLRWCPCLPPAEPRLLLHQSSSQTEHRARVRREERRGLGGAWRPSALMVAWWRRKVLPRARRAWAAVAARLRARKPGQLSSSLLL